MDQEITGSITVYTGQSLAFQTKDFTALRARFNFDARLPLQGGNINTGAQRGIRDAQEKFKVQCLAVPLE